VIPHSQLAFVGVPNRLAKSARHDFVLVKVANILLTQMELAFAGVSAMLAFE